MSIKENEIILSPILKKQHGTEIDHHLNVINNNRNNVAIVGTSLNSIGVCFFNKKDFENAIKYFKKVIEIKELDDVHRNIAICNIHLKTYNIGLKHLLRSYELNPNNHKTLNALGELYFFLKEYDKSISFQKRAIELGDDPNYKFDISFPYLVKKDFMTGFRFYESRLAVDNKSDELRERVPIPQLKLWSPELNCNKLLIISEQGLGDNIQYFRYIIELSKKYPNMLITFFTKMELSHLFTDHYYNINVVTEINNVYTFDYKLYIMSLPFVLKIKEISYNTHDYIKVQPSKFNKWNNRLKSIKRFKIAFTCMGLLDFFIEKKISLNKFFPLLDLDIELISLHKKTDNDVLKKNIPQKYIKRIHFYDIDCDKPFEDTIAILKNIDLLLSVDTVTLHLAGILNVNAYLLLGKMTDWRWFDNNDNPWYKTVKIIRMKENWEDVISTVKYRLLERGIKYLPSSSPTIPVSIGELFDKYTILKIKQEKIRDIDKLNNVKKELKLLEKYTTNYKIPTKMFEELKAVNSKLWETEDNIRLKEHKKEFDAEFIELARSVYTNNDIRAAIKNDINVFTKSDLVEVKAYENYCIN